jgi:hypothetical protein
MGGSVRLYTVRGEPGERPEGHHVPNPSGPSARPGLPPSADPPSDGSLA